MGKKLTDEQWLNGVVDSLADDNAKADVLKVKIAESESTKRTEIKGREETRQRLVGNDGYHFVRGVLAFAVGIAVVAGSICAYHMIEAWQAVQEAQIHALHPQAPAPAASAAPAASK